MRKKIGFCLMLAALQASATTALQQLHQLLDPVHTLKADFVQSTENAEGQLLSTAAGQLKIKRPGKFYWRTTQPGKQTIIINDKQLWLYDEDLQQVTSKQLSLGSLALNPAFLLSGDIDTLAKGSTLKRIDQVRNACFLLRPKSLNSTTRWIKLAFSGKSIQSISFENQLGQVTTITLQKTQLNPQLQPKIFNFQVPAGVDLLSS